MQEYIKSFCCCLFTIYFLLLFSFVETVGPSEKQKIYLVSRSEEIKCLWEQELQSLDGFQDLLTSVLKINLDPKRELGGDYRSLAGVFGKDMRYIWYLETRSSPIEELLKECRPTLGFLRKLLSYKEVDRGDVAKEITAWVKKKGGCCSECDFSLRWDKEFHFIWMFENSDHWDVF